MRQEFVSVIRRLQASRNRPAQRLLDVAYGPGARALRAQCAGILLGRKVPASAKEVQWHNFRALLFAEAGVVGSCQAEENARLEELAATVG